VVSDEPEVFSLEGRRRRERREAEEDVPEVEGVED